MAQALALTEHARQIQQEHDYLLGQLNQLQAALARMQCYSEVFASYDGAEDASRIATRMLETILRHFEHEEKTILIALGRRSPAFAREMQRQHDGIRHAMQAFTTDLLYLQQADDPAEAIQHVKDEGEQVTRMMVAHMDAEERRYYLLKDNEGSDPEEEWGNCERFNV